MIGANPREFHAKWQDNGTALSLCTQRNCIVVQNWCQPIHRLHYIEFFISLDRQPIVIRQIDQIDCQRQINNNKSIKVLNRKFKNAQQQLLLTSENDDNDDARLIRCVGSLLAETISHKFMYRLFDLSTIAEQASFMRDNCHLLFTHDKLNKLTLATINEKLQNTINKFEINEITKDEKESIQLIREKLSQLRKDCWQKFINILYSYNNATEIHTSNVTSDLLVESTRNLLTGN